jgi:hypothetical protein
MWNKVTKTRPAQRQKVIVLCVTGQVSDAIRDDKFGGFKEKTRKYLFLC